MEFPRFFGGRRVELAPKSIEFAVNPVEQGKWAVRANESALPFRTSTKIVGVGLQLEADRRRGHDVVLEPMFVTIGDRRVLRLEVDPHLRAGIARPVPAGQRIGAKRLLALKLQEPFASIGLSGLRRPALQLRDAGDGHRDVDWQSVTAESSSVSCASRQALW
jgi:hypothetical protein